MKIECVKEKILDAVNKADRFTGKNTTLPALSGVLLETQKQELIIRATNLDLGIEIKIPAKIYSPGKVLVPSNIFSQFLNNLRGEKSVTLELKGDTLHFSSESENVKFKTLPAEEFPVIPKQEAEALITTSAQNIALGLKSVFFAASPSSMKPELSSVYVYGDGNDLVFVGTDSFRLAEKKIRIDDLFEGTFLLPFKNTSEIIRTLDDVKEKVSLKISKNQISIETSNVLLVSRIVEGSYPDYRQVIYKEPKTEAVFLRDDFEGVMKSSSTFTNKFHQISINISVPQKVFTISSSNQDTGELVEKIDAALSGESIEINFNHKYTADVLQALKTDSLSFSLNGSGKPAIIKPVGDNTFLYVVMPMNR